MDFTSTIGRVREQSPEQWLRSANRFLPAVVTALLVLAIAYKLAELTWALVPGHAFDLPAPVIVQSARVGTSSPQANLGALEGSHLFGRPPERSAEAAPPQNAALDAPDTTLPLRLTGVIADQDGELSHAIIASGRGVEKAYGIGQTIDDASGATLQAVFADRVILNRGGMPERLVLPSSEQTGSTRTSAARMPAPAPAPLPVQTAEPAVSSSAPAEGNDTNWLANTMRLAPHLEGGQMVGFRVNPGRNPELFQALGLQPGDVITDINGISLDTPDRALQVFDALQETAQANVTVMRDGATNVLVVDTAQIESMAQGRQ